MKRLPFSKDISEIIKQHWSKFTADQKLHLEYFGESEHCNTALPFVAKAFKQAGFERKETQDILIPLYREKYPQEALRDVSRACDLVWEERARDGQKSATRKQKKWSSKPQPNTAKRNFNHLVKDQDPLEIDTSCEKISTSEFLQKIYPKDARIVISKANRGKCYNDLIKNQVANLELDQGQYCYVIANPVTASKGTTLEGKPSNRSKDVCTLEGDEKFLILEHDGRSREDQLKFFKCLIEVNIPLICIVDAQGKSLHGWISVVGLTPEQKFNLKRFFVQCGLDPAGLRVSQLVRLAGGHRDGDPKKRQNLVYFNENAISQKLPQSALTDLNISSFKEEDDELGKDLEEADRFIAHLGGVFVRAVGLGWYRFQGDFWVETNEASLKQEFLKYVRLEKQEGRANRAEKLSSKRVITNIVALVVIELTQYVTFDTQPMLLGVENGVIDLETCNLRKGRPEDYISKHLNTSYESRASCPQFTKFMERIFRGDSSLLGYMQRLLGYMLTGRVNEQKMFFFYGEGANGKSTLINVMQSLMGGYARRVQEGSYIQTRQSASDSSLEYVGARFAYGEEMPRASKLAESQVKNLTGGDKLLVKKLYNDRVEVDPTHKLVLFGNYKPQVSGTDHGIWRRIVLIPFIEKIEDHEKIPNLIELLEQELSGILNWMLEGLKAYLQDGLQEVQSITTATAEYKIDEDIIAKFIEKHLDRSNSEARTSKADVFKVYLNWCKSDNAPAKTANGFHKAMREHHIHPISNNYAFSLKPPELLPSMELDTITN